MNQARRLAGSALVLVVASVSARAAKETSAFFPGPLVNRARENIARHPWAAAIRDRIVKAAEPWLAMSDDELWALQFGPKITRSWMVWSNGHCPACKQGVPMYNWEVDALRRPWKMRCPHCRELFPKNDFGAFYRSGLDEHGLFDPARADRKLLFNAEHPEPADPLHKFGVDDGEGYVEGEKRWRFIGAYLIYGQWKQAIVGGMRKCAEAYVVTGDPRYAHKAGVLLDRAADVYPSFDFKAQGLVYEQPIAAGYVSVWHDACWETREMVLTYDMILPALVKDAGLQEFLAGKARQYKLENPKASLADVRRNIEERILIDCQKNRAKITSNYPQTDITIAFAKTALGWPENRDEVGAIIGEVINRTTAVDGTSGEKGTSGYSAMAIQGLANLLAMYARVDPGFLPGMFARTPRLHGAFRFHMNAWCLQRYYPSCGDSGSYCAPVDKYVSVGLAGAAGMNPSMYRFLWDLYQQTGDHRFVQALYHGNGGKLDGLPHDLFAEDPRAFQEDVRKVIDEFGTRIQLPSVNNTQWRLGLLRSGKDEDERVLWLDYDSGGRHAHSDGMNLGLFARGLDLMPDFGYPPVQYGGWGAPRAQWYMRSMAHNTVVVDGADTRSASGRTLLWADGRQVHAIVAACPEMIGGGRYERTAALVDLCGKDFYVLDIFRVAGGSDHSKFFRSHFGSISTQGVPDTPARLFPAVPHMRNWRGGPAGPGWSVDWKIEDRLKLLPGPADLHVRYTDLTAQAQAYTGESWVSVCKNGFTSNDDSWVPHVVCRRQASSAPLASTFVSVIEPYDEAGRIVHIRRLALESSAGEPPGDSDVAVELAYADGRRDLIVSSGAEAAPAAPQPSGPAPAPLPNAQSREAPAENGRHPAFAGHPARPREDRESLQPARALVEKTSGLVFEGRLCLLRRDPAGRPVLLALGDARRMAVGPVAVRMKGQAQYVELALKEGAAELLAGDINAIEELTIDGVRQDISQP